jgi:hypothetical protein
MSVERIVIELETPGDSRSLFRLRLDYKVVGENLTAVQAHLLVGEILDRITLPRPSELRSQLGCGSQSRITGTGSRFGDGVPRKELRADNQARRR